MKHFLFNAIVLLCLVHSLSIKAQQNKEIDPSKKTNLYTQVNSVFEYSRTRSNELFGARFTVKYASNPDNLLSIATPMFYNTNLGLFGLSDTRIKYFRAVKRDLTPVVIALVPFVDVTVPTGSYKKEVGSSTITLSGGVLWGLTFNKYISLFPGLRYLHVTKPLTKLIPESAKSASNGIELQTNTSINFTKRFFVFVNPIINISHFDSQWSDIWSGELIFNYIITPNKFKFNAGWYPDFTKNKNSYRIGGTVFF